MSYNLSNLINRLNIRYLLIRIFYLQNAVRRYSCIPTAHMVISVDVSIDINGQHIVTTMGYNASTLLSCRSTASLHGAIMPLSAWHAGT